MYWIQTHPDTLWKRDVFINCHTANIEGANDQALWTKEFQKSGGHGQNNLSPLTNKENPDPQQLTRRQSTWAEKNLTSIKTEHIKKYMFSPEPSYNDPCNGHLRT